MSIQIKCNFITNSYLNLKFLFELRQMQTTNLLDIKEFFSICHQLVLEAGHFIKQAHDAGGVPVKRKPSGEAYTDIDLKIQTFYIKAFKQFWPGMKIIGEETQDYEGPIDYNYSELNPNQMPPHLFEGLKETQIDLNNAILWIDPIDATSQFVKGKMNWVTTLLGISVNGRAKLGVIGRYYDRIEGENGAEETYQWNPKCYFADADYPHFYVMNYLSGNKIEEVVPQKRESKEKLTCAMMYFDKPERIGLVEKHTEIYRIGGAEGLAVAEGYSDLYVYRGLGYQKWDLCAGEAILSCLGGTATDPYGKRFVYEEEEQTWDCPDGQLICRSKEIFDKVVVMLNPKEEKTSG